MMEFRSSNTIGYVHYQGDIVSNVSSAGNMNSSHGVQLTGGSTGGRIIAAGDETNIAINLVGKGSGPVVIGNTSQAVNITGTVNITSSAVSLISTLVTISSGGQFQLNSTAPWRGFIRSLDTGVTTPAVFNDTTCGRVGETSHVVTGASSMTAGAGGSLVFANSVNLPAGLSISAGWLGSTADDVHLRWTKGSTVAVAGTTCTVEILVVRF